MEVVECVALAHRKLTAWLQSRSDPDQLDPRYRNRNLRESLRLVDSRPRGVRRQNPVAVILRMRVQRFPGNLVEATP